MSLADEWRLLAGSIKLSIADQPGMGPPRLKQSGCLSIPGPVPSGKPTKSYWKWPFIVSFPIKNGDFP